MPYDEYLGERIENVLNQRKVGFEAKKMMGGLCFMVDDKMCLGIVQDQLMARIDPEIYDDCLAKEGCVEMNFTGRTMKGFVFVESAAIDRDDDLEYWVDLCLDFNPLAKSSKKNKK